jgi:hypothetical protein
MQVPNQAPFPAVATWRINAIRFIFLLMALVMGSFVWSLLGVRYPMQMLPLMIYEIAWKTIWILLIALRAWLAGKWNADIEGLFFDCVGIVIAYFIVPWRYVWARYGVQGMEPLRSMQ